MSIETNTNNNNAQEMQNDLIGKKFFSRYEIKEKIYTGSEYTIYKSLNTNNNKEFAIKIKRKNESNCNINITEENEVDSDDSYHEFNDTKFENESYMLSMLKGFGIPELYSFGYNSNYNLMIMELLGQSLNDLFKLKNKKFSLKTTCMLGIQMIDRIEYIHSLKIIHTNLKPNSFLLGKNSKSHILFLSDFGSARKYWKSNAHIKFSEGKTNFGSTKFLSGNALNGYELSRRDDLESIAYIIIYFLKGCLPWQGLKINNKEEKYKKICEIKNQIASKYLCKDLPEQIETFVEYVKKLEFTDVPNYNYLKDLLKKVIEKLGEKIDFWYDWCTEKPNILPDDPIFTNDYKIEYNGAKEWLNTHKKNEEK